MGLGPVGNVREGRSRERGPKFLPIWGLGGQRRRSRVEALIELVFVPVVLVLVYYLALAERRGLASATTRGLTRIPLVRGD